MPDQPVKIKSPDGKDPWGDKCPICGFEYWLCYGCTRSSGVGVALEAVLNRAEETFKGASNARPNQEAPNC